MAMRSDHHALRAACFLSALATTAAAKDPEEDELQAAFRLSVEQIKAQYTPSLAMCLRTGAAARGVSAAMGGCFHAELKVQDARLNAAYRAAMRKRGLAERIALRNRQRAWITRRDEECQTVAVAGTIDLVDIPRCLLDETVRRRIVLQPMAD